MRFFRAALALLVIFALGFAIYVGYLYRQLESAFLYQKEFSPTQIYSDVQIIKSPMTWGTIKDHLDFRGYQYQIEPGANRVSFRLNTPKYPKFLLEEYHVTLTLGEKPIHLQFDSEGGAGRLESIASENFELSDLYLEPALIATLSRPDEYNNQIRAVLDFSEIPASIWKAVIAIEDQHFLGHRGFDWRGLGRAVLVNIRSLSFKQGGSTVTQQLVKNLMGRRNKNVFKKISELFLSIVLETRFEKESILARYLNEVYLGQIGNLEIHGIEEGAKYFFNKNVRNLNLAEIAMMVGLIRGPGYYSPYRHLDRAIARQKTVLVKMVETRLISESEAIEAQKMPIRITPPPTRTNHAPYFVDYVKAELIKNLSDRYTETEISDGGLKVYTTLNITHHRKAENALQSHLSDLEKNIKGLEPNTLEGAVALVENKTGYIRSLVGGRNYSESTFNRILNMKRQIGSIFKPVVYLSALKKGRDAQGIAYGGGYPLLDDKVKIKYDNGRQTWSPENYGSKYSGWITFKESLIDSVNASTARLGAKIGIGIIHSTAKDLGFSSDLPRLPALVLGISEHSPIEVLKMYSIFANRGIDREFTVLRGITDGDGEFIAKYHPSENRKTEEKYADFMTQILSDVFTAGTARRSKELGFTHIAAGKTGTTSNYRDTWFAGFTPQFTNVVWVGSDRGETGVSMSGAGAALPVWTKMMQEILDDFIPSHFQESEHLTTSQIDKYSGEFARYGCPDENIVNEIYLKDNLPNNSTCELDWKTQNEPVIFDLN